jgi:hypothetical protein
MTFKTCAVVLALAWACSAGAQSRTLLEREITTAEAAQTLQNFARCVVIRAPNRARDILAMDFNTDEYRDRIRSFAQTYSHCAPSGHRLGFSGLAFAGDMAEQLLLVDANGADLAARVAYDPARPPVTARAEQETMALCAVRAAPQKVAALLATPVFSTDEAAALRAMMPEVQSCLAAGVRLGLNRISMRALLALAAYRLAEHNRAGAAPHAS